MVTKFSGIKKNKYGEYEVEYTTSKGTGVWCEQNFMDAVEFWLQCSLYYPYHDDRTKEFESHEHRFEDVIRVLLKDDNALHMDILGYENDYSDIERQMFWEARSKRIKELEG